MRFDINKHGRGLVESTYKFKINRKTREKHPLKTNSHQFTSYPDRKENLIKLPIKNIKILNEGGL